MRTKPSADGKVNLPAHRVERNLAESGIIEQRSQGICVAKRERSARTLSDVPIHRGLQDSKNWLMLNPSPDRNDGPAARRKHASLFPGGGEFVRHELNSLLTQHEIERRLFEWKFLGVPLSPFDRRARRQWKGSGNLQHLRADVQPGDRAVGADQGSDLAGDNAGATGYIEDTFARAGFRTAEKLFRPRQEHRGNEVRFIRVRWVNWCCGLL